MGIMGRVMETKKGSNRRFWSDEEKHSICLQARAPGVSVAQVARRYAMNANLIHTWLRDWRFATLDALDVNAPADDVLFLPVELDRAAIDAGQHQVAPVTAQRVDIALSDGRRILVEGTTALAAVITMVEGLST